MGRRLPFDYAVRNLGRRRLRTALTGISAALVAALLVATAAFVRGLEGSFAGAAQADCAILLSSVSQRDVVRSTVGAQVPGLIAGSVPGVLVVHGRPAVSGEIHMGTQLRLGPAPEPGAADPQLAGFVRGVTDAAFLVHEAVTLTEGAPPGTGEVIVGRLVARQLGVPEEDLAVGKKVRFEDGEFTISGRFAAPGTTTEAEIWAPLVELRGLTRRDDSSIVFVRMESPDFTELDLFAKRRLDLELIMIPSSTYYRELSDYFEPIRKMAWALAAIMGFAALFGGANTLNAAVQDRLRELAMLRALGYSGFALVRSLATEAFVLSAAGGLLGLVAARILLAGSTVRIAMSAFALKVDAVAILAGFAGVLILAILGAAPAAARVFRLPIATALKEP
jgi:putative ABC transport system permease protein